MNDFEGKVAFISGGSSGIGLGIARAFSDAGMQIALGYQTNEHLDDAMLYLEGAADRIHAIRVDVTDRSDVEAAAEEATRVFGKIHVLVSNAGVQDPSTLLGTSYAAWDRLMGVNVGGVFNTLQAIVPLIRQHREGGHVVATASILGFFTVGSQYAAYCVSKFAVVAMMEALRAELAADGIGVSVLCPGLVRTNLEQHLRNHPDAADPGEIGRLVLRGVRNNDLYIFTHPEWKTAIRVRNEAIMASTQTDAEPPKAVVDFSANSIYRDELDRHLTTS